MLTCNEGIQIVVCVSDGCDHISLDDELNQLGEESWLAVSNSSIFSKWESGALADLSASLRY